MRVLDLFSGIGGFSIGLERAGMSTVAFCECEPFPTAVLAERWPHVPCYPDVRELTADRLAADGLVGIDVIAGGFPCQDISLAGKGAGLGGERSGLFREVARLAGEVRPRWIFLENVAALRSRGLEEVLGALAALGYDACWDCLPASAIGAPHRRDRVWIVAAANTDAMRPGCRQQAAEPGAGREAEGERHAGDGRLYRPVPNALGVQLWQQPGRGAGPGGPGVPQPAEHGEERPAADPISSRLAFWQGFRRNLQLELEAAQRGHRAHGWWSIEPPVGRVADGVPARVHRLRALGNAVVPAIPEIFGRAILATEYDQ